ncbi:putative transporter [Podospora australis]|uniref:Transporter n=1 Tax=Podospora australis TaxID=1536484 RepID=A0AAN6X1U8_9PEZI|nr:putative transporter [Podospora australis]
MAAIPPDRTGSMPGTEPGPRPSPYPTTTPAPDLLSVPVPAPMPPPRFYSEGYITSAARSGVNPHHGDYESPIDEEPPFIPGHGHVSPKQLPPAARRAWSAVDTTTTTIRPPSQRPSGISSTASIFRNRGQHPDEEVGGCYPAKEVTIKDRICEIRWTWFTMTMATGGVANVLHSIPYNSDWLSGIGLAFFFLNICLFITNCVLISLRFHWRPGSFVDSFTEQFESLFISSIIVSTATIMITICQYGVPHVGPWLLSTMEFFFWLYVGVSTVSSAGLYLTLWSTQVFPIHTMTPVWVFPAYPLLLAAPFGSNLISAASRTGRISEINTVSIAMAAITAQGTGFLIAFMINAAFLYRLMTQKLPRDNQRPGVFISIGPSGFTAAGIVSLGSLTSEIFPRDFMGTEHAVYILRLMAYMVGLWLWGLSVWFFLVSVGSLFKYISPEKQENFRFQMTWFSFVFPNTALVTATEALGGAFDSDGLKIFGCVLAGGIVVVWVLVFSRMMVNLWRREL